VGPRTIILHVGLGVCISHRRGTLQGDMCQPRLMHYKMLTVKRRPTRVVPDKGPLNDCVCYRGENTKAIGALLWCRNHSLVDTGLITKLLPSKLEYHSAP